MISIQLLRQEPLILHLKRLRTLKTSVLRNPAQLRLFHLKLDGDTFIDEGLYKCLRRNIGYYVYSRTRIAKFKEDDDEARGYAVD